MPILQRAQLPAFAFYHFQIYLFLDGTHYWQLVFPHISSLQRLFMARARLQISMSPELEHALRDLQDATGLAMASFVSEVMEHNVGMIKDVAHAARRAKGAPGLWMLEMIKRTMDEALREASGEQVDVSESSLKGTSRPYTRRSVRPSKVTNAKA
jgi:hypothetical protein